MLSLVRKKNRIFQSNVGRDEESLFDAETIDMEDAGEIDVKNTRSMMREGGEIYWNANDMLGVFTQNGSPQKFKNGERR